MIEYCPCKDEQPDPCPACGATISGNDRVRGVCQARHLGPKPEPLIEIVLIDRWAPRTSGAGEMG